MTEALLALLVATVASFIGSLQAGLVNTAVLAATLRHGPVVARNTAFGGALPEFLYAALAFLAADRVLAFTSRFGISAGIITGVVLVVLGGYFLFFMRPLHAAEELPKRSGFGKGLLLGLMNPQLALFWCGVRLGMEAMGLKIHGWGALVGFSLGAFIGAMILLLLLIRLGGHMRERMAGKTMVLVFRAVGVVLVVAGVWTWLAGRG